MVNVQTEHLDDHTARLTVEVEPERIERGMQQAAKRISQKARIRGFRPGKAPYQVILSFYGRDYVLGEALDELGNDIYREALEASGIEPYAPGNLENVEAEGQKLVFVVPKEPTVDLGDYRVLRVEAETPELTDEMVNEAMENVREAQAVIEPAERPAQMGDQVTFEHLLIVDLTEDEAKAEEAAEEPLAEADAAEPAEEQAEASSAEAPSAEAEPAEGEPEVEADDHEEADEPEGRMVFHQDEWEYVLREDVKRDLFPGFAAQMVGASVGEEREFYLDLPDDFEDEDVAGHRLRVEGHVSKVESRAVPEWSDGLAQRASDNKFQTILELRMDVRKQLQERLEAMTKQRIADEALAKLVEGATLHYPKALVDDYIQNLLQEMDRDMRQQGLTLEDFKRILGKTDEELAEMYRPRAEERAQRAIVLGEFIRREGLEATPEDLEAQIDFLSQRMGGEQAPQFRRILGTDASRVNVSNSLTTERAIDRLVAIARGEEPATGVDREAEAAERAASLAAEAQAAPESAPESAPADPLSAGVGETNQTE